MNHSYSPNFLVFISVITCNTLTIIRFFVVIPIEVVDPSMVFANNSISFSF